MANTQPNIPAKLARSGPDLPDPVKAFLKNRFTITHAGGAVTAQNLLEYSTASTVFPPGSVDLHITWAGGNVQFTQEEQTYIIHARRYLSPGEASGARLAVALREEFLRTTDPLAIEFWFAVVQWAYKLCPGRGVYSPVANWTRNLTAGEEQTLRRNMSKYWKSHHYETKDGNAEAK